MRLTPRGNPEVIDPELSRPYFRVLGSTIEGAIRSFSPIDSATLSGSFTYEIDGNSVTIGTTLDYAKYPEFGTKGPIKPKNGEFLIFDYQGRTYFMREVKGQKAQKYVLEALQSLFPASRIKKKKS